MAGLDVGEERKTSYICWDWNPVSSSPYPRHFTDYAIPVTRKLVRKCATYLYYTIVIVRRNVANGYIVFAELVATILMLRYHVSVNLLICGKIA
jgi:hypothetical protein